MDGGFLRLALEGALALAEQHNTPSQAQIPHSLPRVPELCVDGLATGWLQSPWPEHAKMLTICMLMWTVCLSTLLASTCP